MKSHSQLLIFVPEITPRIEYTFDFVFQTILNSAYNLTTDQQAFEKSDLPKICYSSQNSSAGLFLKAHDLLFEKTISMQVIEEVEFEGKRLFFPSSDDSFLPFDPFALIFYLITRYEEYFPENMDEFERFDDSENILYKLGLHEIPVVDQIALLIAEKLTEKFPDFKIRKRSFQFLTTIDIDNAWAFKNKKPLITFGAILKAILHGHTKELRQRLAVFLGFRKDPYDTYKYILELYKGLLSRIHFFFLIGDRNQYDKNISYKNKYFRELITGIASICEVGIHPSFASNNKPWMFEKEKDRLEDIIQKPVTQSRQHYLKLKFPNTYQRLLKSGITDDYTMGFAKLAGFRAGTCTPFPFFDLSLNQCTELTIHPFHMMDVTLKNHLHFNAEKAGLLVERLMLEVKKVDGTFVSLWHNESLRDSGQWAGWHKVFEQILETGTRYENE
jgi:hypothetical protein